MAAIIGRKVGMTQIFGEDGARVPLTVIEAGPCPVTQVKTAESDGYDAVQLGFGAVKPKSLNKPRLGHLGPRDLHSGVRSNRPRHLLGNDPHHWVTRLDRRFLRAWNEWLHLFRPGHASAWSSVLLRDRRPERDQGRVVRTQRDRRAPGGGGCRGLRSVPGPDRRVPLICVKYTRSCRSGVYVRPDR